MNKLAGIVVTVLGAAGCDPGVLDGTPIGGTFIDSQMKIINEHKAILVGEGRMPTDFASAYLVLGQYGWHNSSSKIREVASSTSGTERETACAMPK